MKRLLSIPPILMVLFLASCEKHDLIATTSTYTFTNNAPARVTLDLYGSQDDYDHLSNRLSRDTIAVGAKKAIPLEALRHYWVDWYSDNYCFSNWMCGNVTTPGTLASTPVPELAVAAANDTMSLRTRYRDTVRAILFDGSKTASTWQMSITNAPLVNGLHTFLFRKNFTGTYTFVRTAGDTVVQEFAYNIIRTTSVTYLSCVDPQISLYPPGDRGAVIASMTTAFNQGLGDQILRVTLNNVVGLYIAHRL